MPETADLLVEIGTEELPPGTLRSLSESFGAELCARLDAHGLGHGESTVYATPRRIAVLVADVAASQRDREVTRRGPALDAAFDASGKPTPAALGFARSCGVEVERLERLETDKGRWLILRSVAVGERTTSLLGGLLSETVARLAMPRRMRWADLDVEFLRPVHWVTLLFGAETVETEILGVRSGRVTYGHRFHHPEALALEEPSDYAMTLYGRGHVIAEFAARKDMIRRQVEQAAREVGGRAVVDDALLEENTALVEWPVAVAGSFDEQFLELPDCVLTATMRGHQRYFPVAGEDGALLAYFVAVSNIASRDPETVRRGNERVIRPRLADAAFFFRADLAHSLESRREQLEEIVFHEKLGSLFDKSERVSRLAGVVAIAMGLSPEEVKLARRTGALCKCDLLTEMVGEFPELQGLMGQEYAAREGEDERVARAIGECYMPRFAGDRIPETPVGKAVSIADKLDTLVGIFGIGEVPSGDKDPYALRRNALGALRVMIEGELALDLVKLLRSTAELFDGFAHPQTVIERVLDFALERLRAYFAEQGVPVDVFTAVQARRPSQPYDFAKRVHAVHAFRRLPEAASLAAANKRIQNILRQAGDGVAGQVDDSLFAEDAEWNLAAKALGLSPHVKDQLKKGNYTGAMQSLAGLKDNVDEFFDNVKVMDDDERIRSNRLALLNNIRNMFLETADISRLQI